MSNEIEKEVQELKRELEEIKKLLKDLIFVAAVDATETMQVTENTSALLRGEVPGTCKTAHFRLRERITEITDAWAEESSRDLKKHLFGHD